VNDELSEGRDGDRSITFPHATTAQNRGYVLLGFSFFEVIDNTNSNLIRRKFNRSTMTGNIPENQHESEKIDLKFIIGTGDPYDEFAY
jgi:hypothetical protein